MQYQQYYAGLYAQYQDADGGQKPTHQYQDALSRLPQSVLDQPANPPPPDVQSVVDKMAEYAAKNGEDFERTVLSKNSSDPRFAFLRPGNEYHAYYTTKKLLYINKLCEEKLEEAAKPIMHSLNPDGKVGFSLATTKLQPSDVTLEDSSDDEGEIEGEGSSEAAEKGQKEKGNESTDVADKAKGKIIPQAAKQEEEVTSLQEREKQVERRRKAALFIEELRRKRERQIAEEKELSRLGLNEDSEEFVGPKRPKTWYLVNSDYY